MKTILTTIVLIASSLVHGQFSANLEKAAKKNAFNKSIKALEEKPNRYFLKTGNEKYIDSPQDEAEFLFTDNNMYADVEVKDDIVNMIIYRYNPYKKEFQICKTYHGNNDQQLENTKFKKLHGDVYLKIENTKNTTQPSEFILFNDTKGLYFHYTVFRDAYNKSETGGGYYKKTKDEKISSEELKQEENKFKSNLNLLKQAQIKAIMSKSDEGSTNSFQKENMNKILFSNAGNEQNKYLKATYKNKFTLNEPIKATIFLEKGLNKYFDTTSLYISENLNSNNESKFKLRVSYDNLKEKAQEIKIEHPKQNYKTSGIFNIVVINSTVENNSWLISYFPKTIEDKEHTVNVEVLCNDDSNKILASGSFVYAPKVGAVMPYGKSCTLPKDFNAEFAKHKSEIKEKATWMMKSYNKESNSKYKIEDVSIIGDWIKEGDDSNTYRLLPLEFLCTDADGKYFIFNDYFHATDTTQYTVGVFKKLTLFGDKSLDMIYCDKAVSK